MSENRVLRWGTAERLEHFIIMVLIPAFIITGLPIYSRDLFSWMLVPPITIDAFRDIHKLAAGLYAGVAIFHVLYHTIGLRKKTTIWLNGRDFKDSIKTIKYYFGLSKELPKIGFHHPTEKILSYWLMAVIFMIFMGISGIVLLSPWLFPIWVHEWALLVHDVFFYLIAFVALMHFYMSILYKENRPLFDGMFRDGTISVEYAKSYHPLWYEEIQKKKA